MKTSNSKKGFTLAELLIVVAIVSVLVAISIPIFKGKLLKAKIATNEANIRAAKGAVISEFYADGKIDHHVYYIYDVKTGSVTNLGTERPFEPKLNSNGIFDKIQCCIDPVDQYKFYTRPFRKQTAYEEAKTVEEAFVTDQFGYTGLIGRDPTAK